MESPATGRYIPQKSKKRVFPGSSSYMESKLEVNRALKREDKTSNRNEDGKVMISSGTSRAEEHHLINKIHFSMEVQSHKKGKGVISSELGVIEVDSDSDDGVSDSYIRKDYMDFYAGDYIYYDDEDEYYAILQSHFDNIDLPTGVEASLPGLFDSTKMKNTTTSPTQDIISSTGFVQSNFSSMGTLNLDKASRKHKVERFPSRSSTKDKHTSRSSRSSTCPSLQLRRDAMKVQSVKKPLKERLHKMSSGLGASSSRHRHGQLISKVPGSNTQAGVQAIDVEVNELVGVPEHGQIIPMEDVKLDQDSGVVGSSSKTGQLGNGDHVLRMNQKFKKFDIVKDHKDHHYAAKNSSTMQPPRNWAKKIQEEWRILKKNLPDMIFVRVYESRMDLLTAVIIGAEGTPYHDGLFFFDVCFPSNYPDVPPEVYYHSGGLRINPNLYNNGKVCLSLLNTWIGVHNENWIPGASTMLQVLVSIQGLILNAKPYFNEPGYKSTSGSVSGEKHSLQYNESTLVLSLKTMVYTMKNPPKHFEDLVIEHFRGRADAILMTCKAYCEGARVGCVVNKGKGEKEGCSRGFKRDVGQCMKMLVGEFKHIGVEDIEKLLEQEGIEDIEANPSLTKKIRAFFGM
ncbi:hypothetical protein L6452_28607 [Arctium lappa]|uniref:Uncharacterized protein n=1 Tax=Arctium lappa TaxID=4217 RepID=A0ACB8ZY07_ARCLA|nr:hypothetical protein L6452_28607 [Arctium lappa]